MATAKIIIKDEVNAKIEGLDLDTRKELVKKFKYFDQKARYSPAYKLGRWDGCTTFFGLGGTTYVSMLDRVLPLLDSWGYYIEVEDQRIPTSLEFEKITEEFWGDILKNPSFNEFVKQKFQLGGTIVYEDEITENTLAKVD